MMHVWRLSDVCLSRTLALSREQRPKTKIGTEVAHVTRDSDTTFIKGQKVKSQLAGAGAYCDDLPHSLFNKL